MWEHHRWLSSSVPTLWEINFLSLVKTVYIIFYPTSVRGEHHNMIHCSWKCKRSLLQRRREENNLYSQRSPDTIDNGVLNSIFFATNIVLTVDSNTSQLWQSA